jgi:hypothetical protein
MGVKLGILWEGHRLSVFEDRALRRIFAPRMDEVTGGWRKLHNLNSSPSIVTMIKSVRKRWARRVARIEKHRTTQRS